MTAVRVVIGTMAIAAALATPAFAQTTIEVYGGLGIARVPGSGVLTLPAAGPPIVTSNPIFPSRQTSSWFLGDGAAMLNDALADLGILNRIAPLDAALAAPAFEHRPGAAFGVRVRRSFRTRFELEASVDVLPSRTRATKAFTAATEIARASFQDTFAALFASGPFLGTTVDASTSVAAGSSRRVALTGALVVPLGAHHGLSPYLTAGLGVLSTFGAAPSVTLTGRYRTTVHAGVPTVDVPIEEFDRLTIRFQGRTAPVGLGGGGVTRSFAGSWAVRVDGRALIGRDTARALMDATPSSTTGSPAGFIELFTFPAIEFSNNPSTGRQSSLSGSGLHAVTIFEGTGIAVHAMVTVGIVKRF